MTPQQAAAALAPWSPTAEDTWDRRKVVHLLRRAAFGGTPADWDACLQRGVAGSLRWLFEPAPEHLGGILSQVGGELVDFGNWDDLRAWWLFRMLHSKTPLVEKMTLFWHGHFATGAQKVGQPELMFRQNELLRRHALGKMRPLLQAVSRDPAMLIWLDNRQNVKQKPNENYARELCELFSLGIGAYGEDDVKSAARAFTGWHLKGQQFFFNKAQHDAGEKTFLGARGRFGGDEIIDVIFEQRAAARFLARKLLVFFLAPDPEPALVDASADLLRKSDFDVRAFLEVLFRSRVFYSPRVYKALVKSPVELCLGAVLATGGRYATRALGQQCAAMGQNLFFPPSVKGWDGGRDWINPTRLLARWNFAMSLSAARGAEFASAISPQATAQKLAHKSGEEVVHYYLWSLLQFDVSGDVRARLLDYLERWDRGPKKPFAVNESTLNTKVRGLIHVIMTLPEYQLC